jgi:hypothetical protein
LLSAAENGSGQGLILTWSLSLVDFVGILDAELEHV